MKAFQSLLPIGFSVLTAIVVFGQAAPRTLPSKGPKWIGPPSAGSDLNGVETRPFHVSGKEYTALLSRREILSGPDWNPALPLPVSLGRIEQAARSELQKLTTDFGEWELSRIELNKVFPSAQPKWYYALTFSPALQVRGLSSDSIVILTTLDGKPGRFSVDMGNHW